MTEDRSTSTSDGDGPEREAARRRLARRLRIGAILTLACLISIGAWGAYSRREDAASTLGRINSAPTVQVMVAKPGQGDTRLKLPGTMEPVEAATIFARVTGYIASRAVDFGTPVKAGDVLAVVAAPDLDQQRIQAQAQLAQAEAAATLQRATNTRTQKLVQEKWQTKQQGDTDQMTLIADLAAVKVAQANLSRLDRLTGFERVIAPFDGVVTDRQVDVGSLVSADSNTGTPLFTVARQDTLRVQVYVPQDSVFDLRENQEAEITVPELSGRVFKGRVSRMASALAVGTRTMLVQVDLPNEGGALRPGLYCVVSFDIKRSAPTITVPSQAVIFNKGGLSVAVVDGGRARLETIELAEDNGASVEVRAGLRPGDQVILSPPVNLTDGAPVSVAAPPGDKTAARP